MKKLFFSILFSLFLTLICFSQRLSKSIFFQPEYLSQYKNNQVRWLVLRGFDINAYSGDNELINLNLDLAMQYKRGINTFLLASGIGIGVSLAILPLALTLAINPNFQDFIINTMLVYSGIISQISIIGGITATIISGIQAKRHVKKAKILLSNLK